MNEPREDDSMLGCSLVVAVLILWGAIFYLNYRDLEEFQAMKHRLDVIERKVK